MMSFDVSLFFENLYYIISLTFKLQNFIQVLFQYIQMYFLYIHTYIHISLYEMIFLQFLKIYLLDIIIFYVDLE